MKYKFWRGGYGRFIAFLGNNILPPLLTDEEEKELLVSLASGNEQARNILVEHNLRLVAHISKKFENTGIERDDLLSIGTIGLIKGISGFSLEKGTRLATFAARCIENEILMYLRANRNKKNDAYLQEPVGVDKEGNEVTLLDLLGSSGDDVYHDIELREEKQNLTKQLTVLVESEKIVIINRYGLMGRERITQREIAKKLGISRSYVSRIEKRAVGKIKRAIEKDIDTYI